MPILRPEERLGHLVAGRYRLDEILGRGGMGVVYTGEHTLTGRKVAIKVLAPDLAEDEHVLHRFFREARAAGALNHPNVVEILDMGHTDDDTAFIVLELLNGESLKQMLERAGKLPVPEALELALPVIEALAVAHENGIVHRDLKPDNIFVSVDGRGRRVPKLLDFGIAKLVEATDKVNTQTGTIIGTPHYMAPEQAMAQSDVGRPADVWSMGVVLYECLSATLPFDAEVSTAILVQIIKDDVPPLTGRAPEVPEALAAIVHSAMSRDVTERPPSMDAFAAELIAAARESDIELAYQPARPQISSHPPRREQSVKITVASGSKETSTPFTTGDIATTQRSRKRASPLLLGGVALAAVGLVAIGVGLSVGGDGAPDDAIVPETVGAAATPVPEPEPAPEPEPEPEPEVLATPDAGAPAVEPERPSRTARRDPGSVRSMRTAPSMPRAMSSMTPASMQTVIEREW